MPHTRPLKSAKWPEFRATNSTVDRFYDFLNGSEVDIFSNVAGDKAKSVNENRLPVDANIVVVVVFFFLFFFFVQLSLAILYAHILSTPLTLYTLQTHPRTRASLVSAARKFVTTACTHTIAHTPVK